jgi:hypothetical protein
VFADAAAKARGMGKSGRGGKFGGHRATGEHNNHNNSNDSDDDDSDDAGWFLLPRDPPRLQNSANDSLIFIRRHDAAARGLEPLTPHAKLEPLFKAASAADRSERGAEADAVRPVFRGRHARQASQSTRETEPEAAVPGEVRVWDELRWYRQSRGDEHGKLAQAQLLVDFPVMSSRRFRAVRRALSRSLPPSAVVERLVAGDSSIRVPRELFWDAAMAVAAIPESCHLRASHAVDVSADRVVEGASW